MADEFGGSMKSSETTQPSPETTVGELRKQYGAHFAAGYQDTDPIGQVLGRAGVATIEEYLARKDAQ